MKSEKNECTTESSGKLSSLKESPASSARSSVEESFLPLKETCLSVSIPNSANENDENRELHDESEISQYDNCSSYNISQLNLSKLPKISDKDDSNDENSAEVLEPLLMKESHLNTDDNADEKTKFLSKPAITDLDQISDDTAVVVNTTNENQQMSWKRVMEEHKNKKAKEAVALLGQQRTYERSSPFGYKNWLLRLSHNKKFEVMIATGIFLWLAFFIVLAIFMNGPSSKQDDSKTVLVTDLAPSLQFPIPPKPAVTRNESINQRHRNNSEEASSSIFLQLFVNATSATIPTKDNANKEASKISKTHSKAKTTTTATRLNTTISSTAQDHTEAFISKFLVDSAELSRSGSVVTEEETKKFGISSPGSNYTSFSPEVSTSVTEKSSSYSSNHSRVTQGQIESNNEKSESPRSFNQLFEKFSKSDLPVDLEQLLQGKKAEYEVGVGRADITGPPADVNMMGYANPSQTAGGIHIRQYARAFIVSRDSSRVVFVSIDACMGSTLVKLEVLKVLKSHYGNLYTADNLCISGTHTHSAPAGFLQDVLFQITSMGYVPETLRAMVDGIVESIHIAHRRLNRGFILINKGELLGSSINRSPTAYLNNPSAERKRYKYNVDKDMILLKFLDEKGNGIGAINWFPVHCTSMNNTNSLISGDNKGYAELLLEQEMDPGSLAGESNFVGAFAQSNEGDVSPNTRGPHCIDTGLPCDNIHSTCDGKVQNCIATGPGKDMFESTKIIARKQFEKALELYNEANTFLSGPLQAVHQYIDMTNQTVMLNNTHTANTCKPAMGFSFAAGTTDGPGAFDFKQGDKSGNAFWKVVRNFLHSPSKTQTTCHYPKPILLDTGEMQYPYSWQPNVVDTQLFRIGQLVISALPGEFTTMSGRRLKEAVFNKFAKAFPTEKFESVVAGLSNTYSDYITTFEEYHVQRYEGASTIFGPHTLAAYVQQFEKLASSLVQGIPPSGTTEAHDLLPKLMSFVPGVVMDNTPYGYDFGDLLIEANDTYNAGDVVRVQFVAGNPRNSPTVNMTFLSVERKNDNGIWEVIMTDADWHTKYIWERTGSWGKLRGLSEVTVKFDTSSVTSSGHYRINHFGHYKYFWNRKIYAYHGRSKEFLVIGKESNS